jgi:hypothetical protein
VIEWRQLWFGSVSGITDHLQIVTLALTVIHTLHSSLELALNLLSLLCPHRLSGNGFQVSSALSFRVCVLIGWRLPHNSLGVATQRLTRWVFLRLPQGATICDDLRRVCLQTANCTLGRFSISLGHFGPRDIASGRAQQKIPLPTVLLFCVNSCCYADVAFHVPLLRHSLLRRNLVTEVFSG